MTQKLPASGDHAKFNFALKAESRRDQTPPGTHGYRARLRERLLRAGPDGLADHEVLEMILFTALPWRDTKPMALALIKRFGSYSSAIAASLADLLAIDEIDETGAVALKLVQTAATRLVQTERRYRPLLHNWDRLIEYLTSTLAPERVEHRRVLYLDSRNRLIADEGASMADPHALVMRALEQGATAMISVHNDPTREPTPSDIEIDITRRLKRAAASYAVVLHDHVIIGNGSWISLKRLGLL
jgi:DNA repair protein RadC